MEFKKKMGKRKGVKRKQEAKNKNKVKLKDRI